ncbi:HTH-transcriptional regulator, MerR family [Gottschalkia acidurici 9a]|uniref:HTH-transcriptional regulator, MerR family n=1 Tax=Gottschalkia acidurici (strain ATCC 7906 / DSM 604 / BCRC 14475 / CIP 104303 / KCTC 5404 / NCIMB 10678 / 9a) TaxID=1128398 RepID=K0B1C7_GOTA9|nr:MerR family transcriptional regulator [Gottschalkia acidurici]AFS78451.1 HTH-transcriptional regulator, MerR family [Gottschalkia acidurici 9a]
MFDTDKEYTISEISEITDYPTHVLRYYEKEFDIEVPRNGVNHRYYTYKEIETFNYIKTLQEKGFSNKQIKLILDSPEMLVEDEIAATSLVKNDTELALNQEEMFEIFKEIIVEEIAPNIISINDENLKAIGELKEEVVQLRTDINSKERDVLICENAKLKLKVQENAYELDRIKKELEKEQQNSKSFLKRLFKVK